MISSSASAIASPARSDGSVHRPRSRRAGTRATATTSGAAISSHGAARAGHPQQRQHEAAERLADQRPERPIGSQPCAGAMRANDQDAGQRRRALARARPKASGSGTSDRDEGGEAEAAATDAIGCRPGIHVTARRGARRRCRCRSAAFPSRRGPGSARTASTCLIAATFIWHGLRQVGHFSSRMCRRCCLRGLAEVDRFRIFLRPRCR